MNSFFNFRVSGEASEAETNGGVGLGGGEAESAEDVGGFGDAGGAGGAGGGGEVGLEGGEQILGDKAKSKRFSFYCCQKQRSQLIWRSARDPIRIIGDKDSGKSFS